MLFVRIRFLLMYRNKSELRSTAEDLPGAWNFVLTTNILIADN